ncbi:DUF4383 domain-containing protein [Pseudonocardiaceae bacterium YIM PH 21723]|nr:DUF4383 domain-containing protein [Pseudonocardiaceae bacterium YIM PH 21723]
MNRTTNQSLGLTLGAIYALIGLAGFSVSGGHAFSGSSGGMFMDMFTVNALSNLVSLVLGLAMLWAANDSADRAKMMNTVVGVLCLVMAAIGMWGSASMNVMAMDSGANLLHLVTGVVLVVTALDLLRHVHWPRGATTA